MATRKAPLARGRGRWVALTTVFFAALIASSAVFSPAFAADKGLDDPGNGNGNGKSGAAEVSAPAQPEPKGPGNGSQGQGNADRGSQGSAQGDSNGKGDHGTSQPVGTECAAPGEGVTGGTEGTEIDGTENGSSGQVVGNGDPQSPIDKDGEPNKLPGDKYNGPCTRHMDPPGNGTGHDWHMGWGKGHNAATIDVPDEPGEDEGPSPEGPAPEESPFLPFTPQPVSLVRVGASTTTAQDPDLPDYLPFTGGEFDALLAVAACAGLAGMGVRGLGHRLYSHRRIAR